MSLRPPRYPSEGESTLMLAEAFPEDTGVYTARASNEQGDVECSSTLTVTGNYPVLFLLP